MGGKIQTGLTRLYAKGRGGVTEEEEYTAYGVSEMVFWFNNDSKRMGDYSPAGTLLMNEQVRDDFSKGVVDYVFLHEAGHDQMGIIGRTLFWIFYLSSGLLFLSGISAIPVLLYAAFQFAPFVAMAPIYAAVMLSLAFAVLLPFIAVCWIDETLAELFAISKLGRFRYQSIRDEVKEVSNSGLLHKIRLRIQYPPESFVLWIARWRGIGGD